MEWLISYDEFNGVDMSRIKKIAIGISDVADPLKASGMVLIDNISYGHTLIGP